jgi:hypothetical protein
MFFSPQPTTDINTMATFLRLTWLCFFFQHSELDQYILKSHFLGGPSPQTH